jgi:hypothetical protein
MEKKILNASEMAKKRWQGVSKEDRRKHAKKAGSKGGLKRAQNIRKKLRTI